MSSLRKQRFEQFRERLRQRGITAALLTSPTALLYLTGFQSDPMERFLALWIPEEGDAILFVPELDEAKSAAAENIGTIVPVTDSDSPYEILRRECGEAPARCGIEKKTMSIHVGEQLSLLWEQTKFLEVGGELSAIWGIKTREEADIVGKAAHIANEAVEAALKNFSPGMTEREVAERILLEIRLLGGDGPAFSPTVLAGVRAGLPHGETGDTPIRNGDFLLIDMGVSYRNYLSDSRKPSTKPCGKRIEER
jgi:Xaa-Pro dipeptidase